MPPSERWGCDNPPRLTVAVTASSNALSAKTRMASGKRLPERARPLGTSVKAAVKALVWGVDGHDGRRPATLGEAAAAGSMRPDTLFASSGRAGFHCRREESPPRVGYERERSGVDGNQRLQLERRCSRACGARASQGSRTVAVYTRVSTDHQTTENQERELREIAN